MKQNYIRIFFNTNCLDFLSLSLIWRINLEWLNISSAKNIQIEACTWQRGQKKILLENAPYKLLWYTNFRYFLNKLIEFMIIHMMKRKYTDFHFFINNTLEEIQFFLQICKLGWNTNFSQKSEISLFSLQFNFYLNERITHLQAIKKHSSIPRISFLGLLTKKI